MNVANIPAFGGLDLYSDPEEVGAGGAIDLLNVDMDRRGRVRTRDGWSLVTSSAASTAFASLGFLRTSAGIEWLVAGDTTTLHPYKADGTAGTTQAGVAASNNSFARFGDPTNTRLYVAASTLYRYDGAAWAAVGAAPISPTLAAVTANDNRLAIATGALDSRVQFSDAGDPEAWTAANWVDLWPGDGDAITALTRWRDKLFAFKVNRFAVFTSTGTDAVGGPEFNYYGVDAGHGCIFPGGAVAGDEGVYFADGVGDIYLTTGGDPVYLSRPIEPWLRGLNSTLPAYAGLPALAYSNRRLIANYGGVQAVFDPATSDWTVWQLTASALLGVRGRSTFSSTLYLGDSVTKKIGVMNVNPTVATDNGSAISWRYQSGWYDLGVPGQEKVIRRSRLTGTGTVTLARFADYGTTDANSAALTLGSSATATTAHPVSWRGTLMSHKLSGSGAAMVAGLSHDIRQVRPVGLRSA